MQEHAGYIGFIRISRDRQRKAEIRADNTWADRKQMYSGICLGRQIHKVPGRDS
jgi:hypothetical protein